MNKNDYRHFHQPTKFVVFPSFGYWEVDGKPVSFKKAQAAGWDKAKWRPSQLAEEWPDHAGLLTDCTECPCAYEHAGELRCKLSARTNNGRNCPLVFRRRAAAAAR